MNFGSSREGTLSTRRVGTRLVVLVGAGLLELEAEHENVFVTVSFLDPQRLALGR